MAFKGAALVYTNGYTIPLIQKFMTLGRGQLGPLPVSTVILVGVRFRVARPSVHMLGRIAYGLGGNEEAVHLSGISVRK